MNKTTILKQGSTIGICAPCARFDTERLHQGVSVLEGLGFTVKIPDNIFLKNRYLAGNDQQRAKVLTTLFQDPQIDGIIAARGGYGAIRILDYLDWNVIKNNYKPFIGFSDCTVLHNTYIQMTGQSTIHGPNVVSLSSANSHTIESLFTTLTQPLSTINYKCHKVLSKGKANGILKGGNLASLSSLAGTPYMPIFDDSILFIEDIKEPAYKIDRMLTQLKLSGAFERLKGVITGHFEDCENEYYIPDILMDVFGKNSIPVLMGLDCGHGKTNLSIPLGLAVRMDSNRLSLSWN